MHFEKKERHLQRRDRDHTLRIPLNQGAEEGSAIAGASERMGQGPSMVPAVAAHQWNAAALRVQDVWVALLAAPTFRRCKILMFRCGPVSNGVQTYFSLL